MDGDVFFFLFLSSFIIGGFIVQCLVDDEVNVVTKFDTLTITYKAPAPRAGLSFFLSRCHGVAVTHNIAVQGRVCF